MHFGRNAALALVLCLGLGSVASAGEVKISFHNGLVTVVATNASVRQVLTEWARVGQTQLVNPERLSDLPQTLELIAVPERRALEILLRGMPGYIAAARTTPVADLSHFDRILLGSPSSRPAVATRTAATPSSQPAPGTPYSSLSPVVEPPIEGHVDTSEPTALPYGVPRASAAAPAWSSPGLPGTVPAGEPVYAAATAGFRTGQTGNTSTGTAARPGMSTAQPIVPTMLPYPTTPLNQPATPTQPGLSAGGGQAAKPGTQTPVPVPTNPYGMPAIVTPPSTPMVNPYGFPNPPATTKPPGGGQ